MKIYRVIYRNDNVGDSGVAAKWLPSKAEVRRFVQKRIWRAELLEEYRGEDLMWVVPKNLKDIVYHQGLNSADVLDCGWAVEEVDFPTGTTGRMKYWITKDNMIDFLNSVADTE